MNYILILLFLIINQNEASDDSSQQTRNINDSFNINIGAGYAVGSDQTSSSSPPNGSSNISFPKNYYSNPSKTETIPSMTIRGPRILTNFTPQIVNPIPEQSRNNGKPQHYVSDSHHTDYYQTAPSYNSPTFLASPEEHSQQPNLVDFKKVLQKLEVKKPYSKVVQVIKVPAIYEIHLQSDKDDDVSENQISVNPTGNIFWKNYLENKPNITTFSDVSENQISVKPIGDLSWKNYYVNKPNITTIFSEEYSKWLESNNMQRQESFTKDGEKYYDFSDTPVVTYENYPEPPTEMDPTENKLKENDFLDPIINHHYNHIGNPPKNFRIDEEVKVDQNSELSKKPTWQTKDYPYSKKPYEVNSFKKDSFRNIYTQYGPKPTSKPFYNDFLKIHSTGVKNYNPFKHNLVISEESDKPQALHEVPAPTLGKHPHTKYFEIQKVSQTQSHPKILPTPSTFQSHTNVKMNKFSAPITKPVTYKTANGSFGSKLSYSTGKKQKLMRPEVVPSSEHFSSYIKGNQNLIYGTKSERVLTPHEINIPVTPGSTMVTVTEKPDSIAQNSVHNFRYSASTKGNTNLAGFNKPDVANNKYNNYNKQVTDISRLNPKKSIRNIQHKNYANSFNYQDDYNRNIPSASYKTSDNVYHNINSYTSEKPETLTSKSNTYHGEVVSIPYQTQKSITDTVSTTQSSDNRLTSNSFTSSTEKYGNNDQLEHTKDNDVKGNIKIEDRNIVISGAAPTFRSKDGSRKRTFNINMDNLTKNGIFGWLKNSEQPQPHQRKNNADYIIYITRKAVD